MGSLPKSLRSHRKKLAQAARLWASGQLTTQADHDRSEPDADAEYTKALEVFGFAPPEPGAVADEVAEEFCLWPENVPLWNVWHQLQTQWRTGFAGRTGLDYPAVLAWLKQVERWPGKDVPYAMRCIQAMEFAALEAWAKQQKDKTQ